MRLIEEYLPVAELSREARREKKGHPPSYEIHYWWTRKPLVIARAAVLASVLPAGTDHEQFHVLLGLNQAAPPYTRAYTPEELDFIANARVVTGEQAVIVDPFAGGGAIPFEALRAGIACVSADLNPVAWLVQKVTLDFPRRFGPKFSRIFKRYFRDVIAEVESRVGSLYPPEGDNQVLAYFYAWEVPCPACGTPTPLVNSWVLAGKSASKRGVPGKKVYLAPRFDPESGTISFSIQTAGTPLPGNCVRARGTCLNPACMAKIPNEWVRQQVRDHPHERLLAIVVKSETGKIYVIPSPAQLAAVAEAEQVWTNIEEEMRDKDAVPREPIPADPRAATAYLYLGTWDQVVNPRQRLALAHLVLAIRSATRQAIAELGADQGKAVGMYLTCLLGKHLNRNCRLTTWDVQGEKIVHACSNKLNALQWNHLEVNPFASVSGSLDYSARDIRHGYKFAASALWPASTTASPNVDVINASVFSLQDAVPGPVDLILTDPPYYDDAPYGEISEFFFAWEVRAIGEFIQADNPLYATQTTPKEEDISVSRARRGKHFGDTLAQACETFRNILADTGRLVMFFAHSEWDAWVSVLSAFVRSGLQITAAWPVHTESVGITNAGKSSSLSSLILVARKVEFQASNAPLETQVLDLDSILSNRIAEKFPRLWGLGLRGLDLFAAATGIACEVLSIIATPDFFDNRDVLEEVPRIVRQVVVNCVLQQTGANRSEMNSITAFVLFVSENSLHQMPLAYAETIAETVGTTIAELEQAGVVSGSGTQGKDHRFINLVPAKGHPF